MWYPGTQGYEIASEYQSDKDKMTVYNSNLDTQSSYLTSTCMYSQPLNKYHPISNIDLQ